MSQVMERIASIIQTVNNIPVKPTYLHLTQLLNQLELVKHVEALQLQ
jgi:hypothetical protein